MRRAGDAAGEYLQVGRKIYIAEATFGFETDTLDGVGQVIGESDASGVTLDKIRAALDDFRGEIEQIPPIYSAIKRDGKKLYDLARAGNLDESELAPRRVTIYNLEATHFVAGVRPRAMIRIECSGGTYIRSLVRDLGRALGCGATMTFLVRTQSGAFSSESAQTLEEIAANPASALLTMEQILRFCDFPIVVSDEMTRDLAQGKRVFVNNNQAPRLVIVNEAGTIAAIAAPLPQDAGCYKPEKVLFLDDAGL